MLAKLYLWVTVLLLVIPSVASTKANSIWWDINNTLSYNALFNFVVGPRGNGKSYGAKKRVIKQFIKTGKQFAYVRRYREEYQDSAGTFFDDIVANDEFPGHTFQVKGKLFLIDDKIAGYGFVLSTAMKKKSMSFPNVWFIIFDEFMLDPNSSTDRYLNNEVEVFLNLYETIARMRRVPCFLLANALTWTNPYFLYFNIKKPVRKSNIRVDNGVLIEVVKNEAYAKAKAETPLGQILKGRAIGKHIIETDFIRDNNDFICKTPDKMRYAFTLKAKGEYFGVYKVPDQGIYFVSEVYEKDYRIVYTPLLENHEPNIIFLKGNSSPPWKSFVKGFKYGCVWYKNVKVKNIVFQSMKGVM